MQYRDELLQQRVRCIVEKFEQRTASEPGPLSRERVAQVIGQVVAELEEERRSGSDGEDSAAVLCVAERESKSG